MIPTPSRTLVVPFLVVLGILLTVGGVAGLGIGLAMAPPSARAPSPAAGGDVGCTITEAFLSAVVIGILLLVAALVLRARRRSAAPPSATA